MKNKKRIGFLSFWGWGRGMCYITKCYAQMIQDEYDVFILKQGTNKIEEEFKQINATLTEYPEYIVTKEFFTKWVKENKLDAIVFNEYKQWNSDTNELVKATKELGVKTYGYLVMEKFKPEQATEYDRIIAPTVTFERFMRICQVRHFTYIPFSLDLNEFPDFERDKNKKFTFFHPGGWGGVFNRKNTDLVIDAFNKLNDDNTKLIITSQKPLNKKIDNKNIEIIDKNLTRKEILDLYQQADVVVLPSKWETIGIPILEALASKTPVITSDNPPMNEFIIEGLNGSICKSDLKLINDISIPIAEIDEDELSKKMKLIMSPMYEILLKNSRKVIEEIYNIDKNKNYFLEFLEKNLK